MINLKRQRSKRKAFSLIEVVIAVAIFTFSTLFILFMLSDLIRNSRETWMETRSALIARQITQDLTPDPYQPTNALGIATPISGIMLTSTNSVQVPLADISRSTTSYTNSMYYDTTGLPVDATNSAVVFKADITIQPFPLESATNSFVSRDICQLEIDVRPSSNTNAIPWRYYSRITPQASY